MGGGIRSIVCRRPSKRKAGRRSPDLRAAAVGATRQCNAVRGKQYGKVAGSSLIRRGSMRNVFSIGCLLALTLTACQSKQSSAPSAAQPAAESTPPLVLTGQVPLEGVKGRFDHFGSGKGNVFVSGLGNNTVEVISVFQGTRIHEITGVPNPQGVVFSPEA